MFEVLLSEVLLRHLSPIHLVASFAKSVVFLESAVCCTESADSNFFVALVNMKFLVGFRDLGVQGFLLLVLR